jgi:aerobic-type carbon monoxide dehydrogenase small subunit (CoxS/CutS family)
MIALRINGKDVNVDAAPDTPLLWVLRDSLAMTGTKFGCGIAQCGACTVHIDGTPSRSCQLPVSTLAGKNITTIEGISTDGSHPVQQAWIAEQVPQCGYCQSGQIMSAVALLAKTKNPTDADIDAAMSGNVCRCGTYQRIRRAIHRAAGGAHEARDADAGREKPSLVGIFSGHPRRLARASRWPRRFPARPRPLIPMRRRVRSPRRSSRTPS